MVHKRIRHGEASGEPLDRSRRSVVPSVAGQCGSTRRKGFPAPVILWEYGTRRMMLEIDGLTQVKCPQ